jgi:predicted nucleic acid-binding protein
MGVVIYMEAYPGLGRGPDPVANAAALRELVEIVRVLSFTVAEARRCAEVHQALRQQGRRVNSRALDLMIAATAVEHGLTLVTRNTRDYHDIPGAMLYRSS